MKKFWLAVMFVIITSNIYAQRSILNLVGKWEAVDAANSSGGLEILDSSKLYLVYGSEKKEIVGYKADFSKNPAWFDFTIKNENQTVTMKSLIQFINDDMIQWQVFDSDSRPENFASDKGDLVYLKRKK